MPRNACLARALRSPLMQATWQWLPAGVHNIASEPIDNLHITQLTVE
jgi:hypothetical protein